MTGEGRHTELPDSLHRFLNSLTDEESCIGRIQGAVQDFSEGLIGLRKLARVLAEVGRARKTSLSAVFELVESDPTKCVALPPEWDLLKAAMLITGDPEAVVQHKS